MLRAWERQTVGLRVLSWVGVVGRPTSCDADAVISQRWFRLAIPKQEVASRKIQTHRPVRTYSQQESGHKTPREGMRPAQRGKRLSAYVYRLDFLATLVWVSEERGGLAHRAYWLCRLAVS